MDRAHGKVPVSLPLLSILLAPLAVLGLLFLYPVAHLIWEGARLPVAVPLWRDAFFWHVLAFTYGQAFLSTVLAALVGIPGALLVSEQSFRGRRFFWHGSLVCFSLPSVLVVLALVGFWGKQGAVSQGLSWLGMEMPGSFHGWAPILLAHVFFNYPLFLKYVGTALRALDRSEEMAALSLGASRAFCFFRLTLPKLSPALRGATLLSFLYCSTSFLIVLMLGGGPRFTTLEVAIYQAVKFDFDLAGGVRLALVQLLLSSAIFTLLVARPAAIDPRGGAFVALYRFRRERSNRWLRAGYFTLLFLLAGGPLLCAAGAGVPGLRALSELGAPVGQSLWLAALTSVLSLALALPLAFVERHTRRARSAIALVATLPLFLSGVLLTVSWMTAFPSVYWRLRGSLVTVAAIQSVMALPLVYRPLRDGLSRIPDELYRSAASLGAGRWQTWRRVELPLLTPALRLAALLAAAFSLGEIGSVLLLLSEQVATLPLWIYYRMGQYRFDDASAGGLALVLLMLLVYWMAGGDPLMDQGSTPGLGGRRPETKEALDVTRG